MTAPIYDPDKEKKVELLKEIDSLNDTIKEYEEDIKKNSGYITQGSIGILLGLASFISGFFISSLCFFGTVFFLAGIILWIINFIEKPKNQRELEAAKDELNKCREMLYRLS